MDENRDKRLDRMGADLADLENQIISLNFSMEKFKDDHMYGDIVEFELKILTRLFHHLNLIKDMTKEFSGSLNKTVDRLRMGAIPDKMNDEGVDKITLVGIGTLYLTNDMSVSIAPGKQESAFEFFEGIGLGDLMKKTLNAQTLKAQIKTMIKEGDEIPEGLFNINPFTRAAIKRN